MAALKIVTNKNNKQVVLLHIKKSELVYLKSKIFRNVNYKIYRKE